MSLPTFKLANNKVNRQSHDFPMGLNSQKTNAIQGLDTIETYGKQGIGTTNFDGMSNVRFDKESRLSMDGASEDQLKAAQDASGLDQRVRRKQSEVLQNAHLKTSLTTNIRNIMRNQDKGLLTTSTRLLNAQVKHAELKQQMESQQASLSPTERFA